MLTDFFVFLLVYFVLLFIASLLPCRPNGE